MAPGLEIGEIAIKTRSTGAKALARDSLTMTFLSSVTFFPDRYMVRESLIQAGVGAGIGAVFSAKDIYEVRALRTRKTIIQFL